jgi:hypothetical protein
MASVSAHRGLSCAQPRRLIIVFAGEAVGCARDVGDLGCTRWHSGAGLRTRVGSMVDT